MGASRADGPASATATESAYTLPEKARRFRILVVLTGFYGNARHQQCESDEADRNQVMAAPPLVHRKGHAGPRDQQCHQDDHGRPLA
jgi:hypothetical protein